MVLNQLIDISKNGGTIMGTLVALIIILLAPAIHYEFGRHPGWLS